MWSCLGKIQATVFGHDGEQSKGVRNPPALTQGLQPQAVKGCQGWTPLPERCVQWGPTSLQLFGCERGQKRFCTLYPVEQDCLALLSMGITPPHSSSPTELS